MLVEQTRLLIKACGPSGPAGSIGIEPETQALLEAVLIHLRLLDEFLGNQGRDTDVKARYWNPGWGSDQWLAPGAREQISWRVAHLSSLREIDSYWRVTEYVLACCEELEKFFKTVKPSERLDAFLEAPELAQAGVTEFRAALAPLS